MRLVLKQFRKKLSYKFLFENAISGICIANVAGDIIDCNETFIQISGSKKIDDILSNNINDCFSNLPAGKPFDFNVSKIENHSSQFYLNLISKTGSKIPCLVSIKHIEPEKIKYILINVIDISKQELSVPKVPRLVDEKDYQIETLKKRLFLCEEKFRKVLELSDSAVCIQTESSILFVNLAWETLTGYSKNEINNLDPTDYIHPDFRKLAQNRYRARLKGKKVPEKYDLKIITKSAEKIWANANISLVDYNEKKALMTVFVDITERMRTQQALKESKKKFQSLFYENNSIMFVVNPQSGSIVDANEAACMFYGYSKAKIKSLNITDISAFSKKEIQIQIDAAMNGKREHFIFKHRLSNNEIRDVEVYSGKVEIKETILLYSVVHDITVRKQAEEALKKSENKLKQLNAQKDRFFSIIAHDLRGPLGTFMQLTEYISENYSKLSDSEFEKYFNHLYTSAKGTFKLLENLLIWTRSQLGAIDIKTEKFNLQELTEETIAIYSESARAKKIDISNLVNNELIAFADKNTVATVIRNLISNAIKFTKNNGTISIDGALKRDGTREFIEIRVADTGLGIPEDKIDKLFRIEENHSSAGTNNEKGTGLGLILCKELVLKNKGNIWVTSEIDEGTVFSFSLPVS